jgi:hypothetical protein
VEAMYDSSLILLSAAASLYSALDAITRLTQRLGRAPTPEEIKAERDMLMRAVYGSMLLAEIIVFNQKIAAVVSGGTFDTYCPMASSQMALM